VATAPAPIGQFDTPAHATQVSGERMPTPSATPPSETAVCAWRSSVGTPTAWPWRCRRLRRGQRWAVRRAARALRAEAPATIAIDLRETRFIDSAGLAQLIGAYQARPRRATARRAGHRRGRSTAS